MENKRDLLVLFKSDVYNEDSLERAVECIHKLLVGVECQDAFCTAHELVARNKITNKWKKILKATAAVELKPFYFLLNKN